MAMAICFLLLSFYLLSNLSPSTAQQHQQKLSSFNTTYSPWPPSLNRTLESTNSIFAAGFRPLPTNPKLYIFAIWYQNSSDKTIIWSLNRNSSVTRSSSLTISSSGTLELKDSTGKNLWQPTAVGNSSTNLVLQGDGSLIFGNWSSFKYPTDTILPSQIINGTTLVSKNGKFMFTNSSDLVFDSFKYWGEHIFQMLSSDGNLTNDANTWLPIDLGSSRLHRLTLDDDGNLRVYSLDPVSGSWKVVWQAIQELCQIHGTCGENYICMSNGSNSTYCVCPPGFRVQNNTAGTGEVCERRIPLRRLDSQFLRLDFVDFDEKMNQKPIQAPNFTTCKSDCVNNPRCLAFAFKFDGTQTCVHQLDRLLYGYWSPDTETALFLRVSDSETSVTNFTSMATKVNTICSTIRSLPFPPEESNTTTRNIAILSTLFAIEIIIVFFSFWAFLKKYSKYRDMAQVLGLELLPAGGPKRFSYAELKAATNNFSNVIGQGGFGVVYKGELPDHRIVAVKRLRDVAGGEAEFWAEVTIIARMHHLNLVRMWGFCAEKRQRMLVYEYIPNGSLAHFLFSANRDEPEPEPETETESVHVHVHVHVKPPRPTLDWNVRYRIAQGVARAIAYLHEECLEWVLHCDIKPENILLEDDFCPKVSDFGLSKLTKKEDKVSMSRIRGTRGYLAPEWVKMEPITAKADVYSFGMVLLEIVSGVRNYEFRQSSMDSEEWYFPRWAFEKVYKEMSVEELLDGRILQSYDSRVHFEMVDRMVKTALWCLQDRAEMRPSMGKVAKMLEGTVEITEPAKPTIFYLGDDE